MPGIIWLAACVGFWLWAAKGRRGTLAQGFLHGLFLGLLCFGILPPAMETPVFYGTAVCAVGGMAAMTWLEGKIGEKFPLSAAALFSLLTVMWVWSSGLAHPFFTAFWGGAGLYAACSGILPDGLVAGAVFRPAISGGAGFLLSAVIFSSIGIF